MKFEVIDKRTGKEARGCFALSKDGLLLKIQGDSKYAAAGTDYEVLSEPDTTCAHNKNGFCEKLSDDEVKEYCVQGPCEDFAEELTTAQKLLWLVENLYFDGRGKSIYVCKNEKMFSAYYENHEEYLEAINIVYKWAKEQENG